MSSIAFSPDNRFLGTASNDGTIRLVDLKTRKEFQILGGHDEANGLSFIPDGKRIISASSDQTVRLWDTSTGNYDEPVWAAVFSPDGKRLLILPLDDTVRILAADQPPSTR